MSVFFSLLGTGGWIPTPRRETTCAILSRPESLFIFDAGTGLARLLEEKFRPELKPDREIHLFLSHYHLDHVAGLVYLPAMFKGRTVHLHAPAADITGYDPHEIIAGLIRKPFNPQSLDALSLTLSIEPLGEGKHDIAGATVRVRQQIHADPSVAYRVDDQLVFATDTAADPATAVFAAGADLLVHEAWIDGVEADDPATEQIAREAYVAHTSARQCAGLAAAAPVRELILCHLNPLRSDGYHEQMLAAARKIFPPTRILEDGESVEF
ncbi:MAG: MBL fold metallo-hydrolase [Actinobacteria bacterium]|nr:MBL fold metallo-hydrolase [Actinomycetota bacterium]